MLAYQQDHLEQFGYYDDEADTTVRNYFERRGRQGWTRRSFASGKLRSFSQWRKESGPKLVEALAAFETRSRRKDRAAESLAWD